MNQQAKTHYDEKQAEIKALLKSIQDGMKKHQRAATQNGCHWGYVGDLTSIAEELQELSDRLHRVGEYAE